MQVKGPKMLEMARTRLRKDNIAPGDAATRLLARFMPCSNVLAEGDSFLHLDEFPMPPPGLDMMSSSSLRSADERSPMVFARRGVRRS